MNEVILDDCYNYLKGIKDNSIDMIYLDPPFYTQREQKGRLKNNKIVSFNDCWKDIDEYKKYIKDRLVEMKRVLKQTGSIFLHCDKAASHYLRQLLDEVFGYDNFQSEIIWSYKRWSNSKKGLLNSHQNIFFYSKTKSFKFNTLYTEYSATTNIDQILQQRAKDENGKTIYKKNEDGNVVGDSNKKGVPLSDVWEIPYLNPKAKERIGYPTQKPIALLERIIQISTDENDIVLDPFCGSGTTLVASKLLNRKYIGIDCLKEAVDIANQRLKNPVKTKSNLMEKGINTYKNKTDDEMKILKMLGAIPVQRNSGIDGFIFSKKDNNIFAVKIQGQDEEFNEAKLKLINAAESKNCKAGILIRNDNTEQQTMFGTEEISNDKVLVINSYQSFLKSKLKNLI